MTLTELAGKLLDMKTAIDRGDLRNPVTAVRRLRQWADELKPAQDTRCPQCAEYRAELEEQDLTISQLQKESDALRADKTVRPSNEERAGRW